MKRSELQERLQDLFERVDAFDDVLTDAQIEMRSILNLAEEIRYYVDNEEVEEDEETEDETAAETTGA